MLQRLPLLGGAGLACRDGDVAGFEALTDLRVKSSESRGKRRCRADFQRSEARHDFGCLPYERVAARSLHALHARDAVERGSEFGGGGAKHGVPQASRRGTDVQPEVRKQENGATETGEAGAHELTTVLVYRHGRQSAVPLRTHGAGMMDAAVPLARPVTR